MHPTLRQLHYLVVLVEKCNFSRAAEACHVTQSTLSGGIRDLEAMLGVRLFERTKRKVMPTAAGRKLAARAQRVLHEVDGLTDIAKSLADPFREPLRLGIIPTIGPFLLPRIMPAIKDRFPDLRLILREDQTARLLDHLGSGDLDLLILAFPYDTPEIERVDFMTDRFWIACPASHRLAGRPAIDPDEIPEEELLLLEDGHCLRDHSLAACQLQGRRRAESIQGTSLYTLLQMVSSGLGITLVPEMALGTPLLSGLDAAYVPMNARAPGRTIGLAWRKSSGRRELFDDISALLTPTQ